MTYVGGGVLPSKSYVDLPARRRKSYFLHTNFLPNFPLISIPFSKETHPILTKLGVSFFVFVFLPKDTPKFCNLGSFVSDEPPPYQISRKSAPKGRHIYVYYVNVRTTSLLGPCVSLLYKPGQGSVRANHRLHAQMMGC